MQTTITCNNKHNAGANASPGFVISFGTRVRELDPLQLFTLSGTNRSDVVYDVASGQIFVTAYVQNLTEQTPLT